MKGLLTFPSAADVATLPISDIPVTLAALAALQSVLAARLLEGGAADADELLDVREAAERLKVSESHVYHHAKSWPFTVRVGGKLCFSSSGIERYLRSRTGSR